MKVKLKLDGIDRRETAAGGETQTLHFSAVQGGENQAFSSIFAIASFVIVLSKPEAMNKHTLGQDYVFDVPGDE